MIIQSGRYKYAKKLMANGCSGGATPAEYARAVCEFGRNAQETIDFLEFLMVQRGDVDVNYRVYHDAPYLCNYIGSMRSSQRLPFLLILLKRGACKEYKERVGRFLVSIGADLTAVDEDGKNALDHSAEQGINLL